MGCRAVLGIGAMLVIVSGCAAEDPPSRNEGDVAGTVGVGLPKKTLQVVVEGSDISASRSRLELEANRPICLQIESDRVGELHVHSVPAQTLRFQPGRSTSCVTVDTP
jgi:hypothetical protein